MSDLEKGFRLSDVLDLLRRRSAFIVCAAVIGLVLGAIVFVTSPTRYSATARVRVDPVPSPDGVTAEVDMATEREIVRGDAVADLIRSDLGLDGESNKQVLEGLIVTVKEESKVLEITLEAESSTRARDVSNAAAEAYLKNRRKDIEAQVQTYNDKIAELDAELAELREGREEDPEGVESEIAAARAEKNGYQRQVNAIGDPAKAGGEVLKEATLPDAVLSKMAVAKGVGVFGVCMLVGLGLALLVDRRDSLGGGRRSVAQLVPNANMRMMPTASGRNPGPAEVDAAIDRLAVELVGGTGTTGQRAGAVLVTGTLNEPPIAMAEELASSLTFAGIPALFVLAGTAEREVRGAKIVTSFADLIAGPSVTGPASLPAEAGVPSPTSATVTWLRPKGSAEASGLLRRAVIEALVSRAGREGFEAVVFTAATPTHNAAAAALGRWCDKVAVIVEGDDAPEVEATVQALIENDVSIDEVVWT